MSDTAFTLPGFNLWDDFVARVRALEAPCIVELGTRRAVAAQPTHMRAQFPAAGRYLGVDFRPGQDVDVVADIHALSQAIAPDSVDAVVSLSTFAHLKYPFLAAHEILKCLKVGGLLFIQTHHSFPLNSSPHDYFRYTEDGLRSLFGPAMGFTVRGTSHEYPARIVSEQGSAEPAFLNACLAGIKTAPTPDRFIHDLPGVQAAAPAEAARASAAPVRMLLAQALAEHRAGRLDQAAGTYRAVLERDGGNADALHLLGLVEHAAGRPAAALALIDRAIAAGGTARHHANRGMLLFALGRPEDAEAACRRAVALDDRHADAFNTWGLARLARGDPTEAIALLRRALALRPGYAEAAFNLGNALGQAERLTEAVVAFREALALRPPPLPAPRRVLFVYQDAAQPGHVYRCLHLAQAARAAGWDARAAAFSALEQADVVGLAVLLFWRAEFTPQTCRLMALARSAGARIGLDLDDLVIDPLLARAEVIDGIRSLGMDEEAVRLHFVGMQRMLLACDFATCTTEELAAEMRRAGRPVSVVPNGFDAAGRRAARQARRQWLAGRPDRLLRIGYAAGTRTHQRDMQVAAPAIARVLAEVPDARLVLFRNPQDGSRLVDPGDLPALAAVAGQIEWRDQVPLAALPAELARFDINIAPLELGNPFVEAKSELKYFEAALAGVPTIASPTGPFRRALCDGTTGLLAADEAAWHAALRRLLGDAALRASLAQAALADALRRFGPASQSRAIGAALALAARDRSESM